MKTSELIESRLAKLRLVCRTHPQPTRSNPAQSSKAHPIQPTCTTTHRMKTLYPKRQKTPLTAAQAKWIKREAAARAISEAAVMRAAIDDKRLANAGKAGTMRA